MRVQSDDSQNLKVYIIAILEKQGRNFYICELCGNEYNKKLGIHHKKYNGATINDVVIACQKCNTQPYNKNLT